MGRFVEIVRAAQPDREISDELESELAARVETAVAAWPGVRVDLERFMRALAARLAPGALGDALAAVRADDLYLACGCADGDAAALAAFEQHCGPVIARAVAGARVPPGDRADVAQIVRQRLLVASDGDAEAKIASYSARGPLTAWVRVVAARESARMLPRAMRERGADDDELAGLLAQDDDPELAYLKRRYRAELKRAFAIAVEALADRDRLVLRQHVVDGLGIDQLATLHHVHRATAARWIESARATVVAATQRELLRELRISREELASIVRLIASQLDVSLPRLLKA